jgi:ATP-dependent RNA helicase DHX57
VPLEEICLSILASGFAKSCSGFLSQAPQPPSNDNIQAALTVLRDIGAIEQGEKTEILSPLGQHLAKLPVNVRLGKMLILASLFNCIDPLLTITASLSSQSPFSTFFNDAAVAKAKQRAFQQPESDFMTFCNVWDQYSKAKQAGSSAGRKFCNENYLNHVSLCEIENTRRQLVDLLSTIGFLDRNMVTGKDRRIDEQKLKSCSFNRQSKKLELVHAIIAAGLYPNVARLDQAPGCDYTMFHRDERLFFHRTSVNASKKRYSTAEKWVVYDEKFGTLKRTSVSTTCFIHPLALILFGGKVVVKHIER